MKAAHKAPAEQTPERPREFSAELFWWQAASEAQKEDILRHEKLAHYRTRILGKAKPGPIFLSALWEVLAQPQEKAA